MTEGTRGGGLSVGDRIARLERENEKREQEIDGVDQYGRTERGKVWTKLTGLEVEIAKTKTRLAIFIAVAVFVAQILGGALGDCITPVKAEKTGVATKEAP